MSEQQPAWKVHNHLLTNSFLPSSIGTTDHCGLWPVEHCPSIFSYLPPTLSIFSLPALEDLFPLHLSFRPSSFNPTSLFLCSTFATISSLLGGVVSPTTNPQPGGPGYPFLSGSSPLPCLAWVALPVAYTTASIALRIMWPHKPNHYVKAGIPSGGRTNSFQLIINLSFCR